MELRKAGMAIAFMVFHTGLCMADDALPTDFGDLSLEQLGDIRVTSLSKRSEPLSAAPASIYVITNDAIRRSGARSVPEALRLAPNLQVAQINANQYAISARGFNSSTANKLLVLIDGRTVYTPLYSGVFWDVQDVLLRDIDRIEVISGPGGTLWGSNAVNGVINIITKTAKETSGDLATLTGGNQFGSAAVRHGGKLESMDGHYRTYAKVDKWRHFDHADGSSATDGFDRAQAGFRSDWRQEGDQWTVQGDIYAGEVDQTSPDQQHNSGGNLLARWERSLASGGSVRVQTYYDRAVRKVPGVFSDRTDTVDLDVQHTLGAENGNQTVWGGGYRFTDDQAGNSALLAFLPAHRQLQWGNVFAQREWSLPYDLRFKAGFKLEYNPETDVEFLSGMRLIWRPAEEQLLWLSLARAIRAPSRIDTDFYYPAQAPYMLAGGPDFRSEVLHNLGVGWRGQFGDVWSASVATFYGQYDHLRSLEPLSGKTLILANGIEGRVIGVEGWGSCQITKTWTLDAGAIYLDEDFRGANLKISPPGNDPNVQLNLRSRWSVRDGQTLDILLRHVGELPTPVVQAYTAVDARFGWRLSSSVDVGLAGHNLFDPGHPEFSSGTNPVEVPRAFDVNVTVVF